MSQKNRPPKAPVAPARPARSIPSTLTPDLAQLKTAALTLQHHPTHLTIQQVQLLQRTVGNRALQRVEDPPTIKRTDSKTPSKTPEKKRKVDREEEKKTPEDPNSMDKREDGDEKGKDDLYDEKNLRIDKNEMEEGEDRAEDHPRIEENLGIETKNEIVPLLFQRESALGFWMRTRVRPVKEGALVDPGTITILDITISPERRATAFGKETKSTLQGAHLVAWSAMVRAWRVQLQNRPLLEVVATLQDWLLQDYVGDKSRKESLPERAYAFQLLNGLKEKQTLTSVFNTLEQAIAIFIETNQAGAFATQGKSEGGRDEAGAHLNLERMDRTMMNPENKGTIMAGMVYDEAKKLIDIAGKKLDEPVQAKVIATWYRMVQAMYPHLQDLLAEQYEIESFDKLTIKQWVDKWDSHYKEEKGKAQKEIENEKTPSKHVKSILGGVVINIRSTANEVKELAALESDQVQIQSLDIPAKLRAPTQFGIIQQSHTLAWTYLRQSLIAQFRDMSADKALTELEILAKRDQASLEASKTHRLYGELKGKATTLCEKITKNKELTLPLEEWVVNLNQLLLDFVTLNQRLPTSTYGSAGQAYGHGEAGANRAFAMNLDLKTAEDEEKKEGDEQEAETLQATSLETLRKNAAKFMDLGLFYRSLLNDAAELSSYRGRNTGKLLKKPKKSAKRVEAPEDPVLVGKDSEEAENLFRELYKSVAQSVTNKLKSITPAAYNYLGNFVAQKQLELQTLKSKGVGAVQILDKDYNATWFAKDPKGAKQELTKINTRLKLVGDTVSNHRKLNAEVQMIDQKKQKFLIDRLRRPAEVAESLYTQSGHVVRKVVGDFYYHLQHFKPELHKALQNEEQQKKLLETVLMDPLQEKEVRIGEPLKIHLSDDYDFFIKGFKAAIKKNLDTWTKDAFTHD